MWVRPEKTTSGKVMLRIRPEVHAAATIGSGCRKSLSQWAD
ncbi:toxin-antitoxin system HicB family antitoxin [Zestomonas carbonaria]|nr:toxin-antitoxin system HicB family antitoxin [Pseudomonas carbonaria]